jgi:hypothetical protein
MDFCRFLTAFSLPDSPCVEHGLVVRWFSKKLLNYVYDGSIDVLVDIDRKEVFQIILGRNYLGELYPDVRLGETIASLRRKVSHKKFAVDDDLIWDCSQFTFAIGASDDLDGFEVNEERVTIVRAWIKWWGKPDP